MIIQPIDNLLDHIGDSNQACYIKDYLGVLKAKTILVEEDYTDKDYLIDFQNFYCRSFGPKESTTSRIHFFSEPMESTHLEEIVQTPDSAGEMQRSYLGFAVKKPVKNHSGKPIVGRTALMPYPRVESKHRRVYIVCPQRANVLGHEMSLHSMPFQSQDVAVGACASAAVWAALNPLFHLFEIQKSSLYEITHNANMIVQCESRIFPSDGLTTRQICGCFRSKGLEIEFMNFSGAASWKFAPEWVSLVIRSYVRAGIPVVAGLELWEEGRSVPRYHAVTISGFSEADGSALSEIYVHDDQVGPYARVFSDDGFISWNYGGNEWGDSTRILLNSMTIPLYHKMRLPFESIWSVWYGLRNDASVKATEVFLLEARKYKEELLSRNFDNKRGILAESMPHYVWVFRATYANGEVKDSVMDATATYVSAKDTQVREITYSGSV